MERILIKFNLAKKGIDESRYDLLFVGKYRDRKSVTNRNMLNKKMIGVIDQAIEFDNFDSEIGSLLPINTHNFKKIKKVIILGMGNKNEINITALCRIATTASGHLKKYKKCRTLFLLDIMSETDYLRSFMESVNLGLYEFKKYKGDPVEERRLSVDIYNSKISIKDFRDLIHNSFTVSSAINFARDLVNEPPMFLTPTKLSEYALKISRVSNLNCRIFDGKEIEKMGMGGLNAVSKGSEEPAKFIHIRYKPRNSKKNIAIVGKGITYDTGGLSLKPSDSMRTMKMDMAGAACVLAVMSAISVIKPNIEVNCLVPTTENMPGGKAYKPDDVVNAYNGKSIEIINTDAEGRVCLADALSYAVKLKADEIIDLATLTGACIVGLGPYTAGLITNNQHLGDRILDSANKSAEKIWQLPLDDELKNEIKSDVADIKNAGSRWGGAISAALFLENFVGDTPWAHLDIAGPAFIEKGGTWYPKGGTGFGVRTIINYITNS